MPITVLIADDTDLMRVTIARILGRESNIAVVGEATNFAETVQLTAALKPDVLLLDLHMPDERKYPPEMVRNQVLPNVGLVLAISVWSDEGAKSLAQRLGAKVLYDKSKMATELVSAIFHHCSAHPASEEN